MISSEKIQEIANKIAKEFNPQKIILFGSHAWGNLGPDSDVDLFVIKDTPDRWNLARDIKWSFFKQQIPMDILVYSSADVEKKINIDKNLFIEDIVKNGKVLYENY